MINSFCVKQDRSDIDFHGKVIYVFEYFSQSEIINHNHVDFAVENRDADQQKEITTRNICPQDFPEIKRVVEVEFAFEVDQNPSESEIHVICFVTF